MEENFKNIKTEEIEIQFLDSKFDKNLQFQIFNLLILCNNEFIPPLSSHEFTTQTNLFSKGENSNNKKTPLNYFKNLLNQHLLVATHKNYIIGFMSFKKDYTCDYISNENLPNLYVSTVIVNPNYRGKGITKLFYKKLTETFSYHSIITRTWSSNVRHLKILNSLGFKNTAIIKNDRGENIDTVFYTLTPNTNL